MVGPGHALQFGDLLDAVLGCADDLDLDVELGGPDPLLRALQAGIGLGHLAAGLVAFDRGEKPVREMVVVVDRLPFLAEPLHCPVLRLIAALGAGDVGQNDRRRVMADAHRDLAVIDDVLGRLWPFALDDDEDAETELCHDLGRIRTDRFR